MANPFYILGSQRSGTTLARLILEVHPDIDSCGELESMRLLERNEQPQSEAKWFCHKIPFWSDHLHRFSFYNGDPIVYMFRDVRDVIASLLSLSDTDTWLMPALVNQMNTPDWADRYSREIEKYRANPTQAAAYALYWKGKADYYFDYVEKGYPVIPVRYEDLVTNTRKALTPVLTALKLTWRKAMANPELAPHTGIVHKNGTTLGHTDPTQPIHTNAIGRWENELSPEQVEQILDIAGDLPERIHAIFHDGE